jgi:hypothetical protein
MGTILHLQLSGIRQGELSMAGSHTLRGRVVMAGRRRLKG